MQRVAEFEKVSYDRFASDMKYEFYSDAYAPTTEQLEEKLKKMYEEIQLPVRATSGSAGYDFKAPFSFTLRPGETIKIPTGIRVRIDEGWWLGCLPRSGLGFKYRLQLDNTMGVIDSDYYFSDNEGHIFAKITNDGNTGKEIALEAGDGFLQALFIPYGITYQDDVKAVRNGGMGSTDGK
jgi:dUTP pyrophosphatase